MELYAAIRRDLRAGVPKMTIEAKYHVGHVTVAKAMESAWPPPRQEYPQRESRLDPFKPVIDAILRSDLDAPHKQRRTAMRIYHRLLDEYGMTDLGYDTVRLYIRDRKPQIRIEAGCEPTEVFIPQAHHPGEEAEVDFGEFVVRRRGETLTWFLFSLRMSFSGKAVHLASTSGGQEAHLRPRNLGTPARRTPLRHHLRIRPRLSAQSPRPGTTSPAAGHRRSRNPTSGIQDEAHARQLRTHRAECPPHPARRTGPGNAPLTPTPNTKLRQQSGTNPRSVVCHLSGALLLRASAAFLNDRVTCCWSWWFGRGRGGFCRSFWLRETRVMCWKSARFESWPRLGMRLGIGSGGRG
ncbi:hypothetical protein [Nocardia sp. NPDC059228]|uniref:hypothetical protein n=1 Tax=Nocardia sp. NPDC059228 TaxID=3346777 RepID=UPI0036B356AE